MRRETTDYIFVHCSATPRGSFVNAEIIDKWHKARGWRGIGYHRVILPDGTVEKGRDIDDVGAHVRGYNKVSIGICLIGGVDNDGSPIFNYTKAQMGSLRNELSALHRKHPHAKIQGHRDMDPRKACPCFDVGLWVDEELF